MVMTQIPIIEFAIGRTDNGKVATESFPTVLTVHADSEAVATIALLDADGNLVGRLALTRDELIRHRDVVTMAIDAAPQINRIETRKERIAAMIAAMPPCRFCNGTSYNSWVDEAGTHHRTAERNSGKCEICHGTGHSDK